MQRRKRKLIKTRLQLKLILVFTSLAVLAALFQVLLLNKSILKVSGELTNDGDTLLAKLPDLLVTNLVFTLAALVPIMVGVGLLVTHRVAGPVYRFERFFEALARGENPGPLRIRRTDELQELCALINRALPTTRFRLVKSDDETDDPVESEPRQGEAG